MSKTTIHDVVSVFYRLWDDSEVPNDFNHHGQDFTERCEGWVQHAIEQVEDEIAAFTAEDSA